MNKQREAPLKDFITFLNKKKGIKQCRGTVVSQPAYEGNWADSPTADYFLEKDFYEPSEDVYHTLVSALPNLMDNLIEYSDVFGKNENNSYVHLLEDKTFQIDGNILGDDYPFVTYVSFNVTIRSGKYHTFYINTFDL